MPYRLVCVHEFHDAGTGRVILRGEHVDDPAMQARLHKEDRLHHFQRVALVNQEGGWEWPPEPKAPLSAEPDEEV